MMRWPQWPWEPEVAMTMIDVRPQVLPEQLLRMPDAKSFELIDGVPVERHVSRRSSRAGARILTKFEVECERTGEAEAYPSDMGYQCFADQPLMVRKGDASVVRMERLAEVDDDPGYLPVPADLVVEVVSPNDLFHGVSEKIALYLANGFGMVWVVDPTLRTVTVHRVDAAPVTYRAQDEITAAPALSQFSCKVAEFFDR
jgi:Uma2 family endonuclease